MTADAQGRVVQEVGPRRFRRQVAAVARVYAVAMDRPADVPSRMTVFSEHASRAGFRACFALEGSRVVGFGYGYLTAPGQWWHDVVAGALAPSVRDSWLSGAFELAELHVLPDFQGGGLGRALLTCVLAEAAAPRALLSTMDRDTPARHLYRSVGFVDLRTGFRFPGGAEDFCIMGARLPLAPALSSAPGRSGA